jgi:Short C-terminal domain/Phospholipase_D-nuclease N-terminal
LRFGRDFGMIGAALGCAGLLSTPEVPVIPLAADYPFLDVMFSMLVFFFWIAWLLLLFNVIGDIFRRSDLGGGGKALWILTVIVLPYLGVFVYLIANSAGMAERGVRRMEGERAQFDNYVRSVAPAGPAAEIEKAKALLDSGAITQAEFDALKSKALAAS